MVSLDQMYRITRGIECVSYSTAALGLTQVGYGAATKDMQSVIDGLELLIIGSSSGVIGTFGKKAVKEQKESVESCPELSDISQHY